MKKKFLIAFLLLVCALCLAFGLTACGENNIDDPVDSGQTGGGNVAVNGASEGLEYITDGVSYMVSGIGACTDTEIVIPSTYNGLPVTYICRSAFSCCDFITSVSIPDSMISIEDYAFYECSALKSINISDSVSVIGYKAFNGTAYYNDENNWEDNVLYMGRCLLEAKTDIAGSYAIKEGTKFIGAEAFDSCNLLESIIIPESVTNISDAAFCYCASLKIITVNASNTCYKSVDGNLYNYDGTILLQYAIGKPDISFVIPDGVTSIGGHSFRGCNVLTGVTVSDSVYAIENYAFCDCDALTAITFGSGVTKIGSKAFDGCISLKNVTFEKTSGWYVSEYEGTMTLFGKSISVTDNILNAANLMTTYYNYYWFRIDQ